MNAATKHDDQYDPYRSSTESKIGPRHLRCLTEKFLKKELTADGRLVEKPRPAERPRS